MSDKPVYSKTRFIEALMNALPDDARNFQFSISYNSEHQPKHGVMNDCEGIPAGHIHTAIRQVDQQFIGLPSTTRCTIEGEA